MNLVMLSAQTAGVRDHGNVQRAQPGNPMVGPIYIEGADEVQTGARLGGPRVLAVLGSAAIKIAKRWLPTP